MRSGPSGESLILQFVGTRKNREEKIYEEKDRQYKGREDCRGWPQLSNDRQRKFKCFPGVKKLVLLHFRAYELGVAEAPWKALFPLEMEIHSEMLALQL